MKVFLYPGAPGLNSNDNPVYIATTLQKFLKKYWKENIAPVIDIYVYVHGCIDGFSR